MLCEGCVITGDIYRYNLYIGDEKRISKIEKIKNKINSLKSYHGEYLIINLKGRLSDGKFDDNSTRVDFFQFLKCKKYTNLNYYLLEIRVDSLDTSKMYNRYVRKKELLQLFDEICLKRKIPDLSKWKMFHDFNSGKNINEDRNEEKISKCTEIARSWLLDELPKDDYPLYFDSLEYLVENDWAQAVSWHEMYLEELEKKGLGEEILQVFKDTINPHALDSIGYKYLYGENCCPDYKKAYRYFYHAEKLGNMYSRYHRALMFKNGLHVKKNYNKYVKMIESIVNEFIASGGKNILLCIDFAFIELAKIYKEKGDDKKGLEYAFKAKELNDARIYNFLQISKMPEILDIIYSMIPFDESDMDIYDLLYLLKKPARARVFANGKKYKIESVDMNGYCMVKFKNKYYKNVKEFFNKASIDGKKIYEWLDNVDYVEVI